MTGSLSQGTATSAGEYLHVSQPVCLFLSQFVILSLSDFQVFLVPSFILPSTVFMSLIRSVYAGWKMWKSCKKQTEIFSQKYSWICFMFLSLFKLLYFCFVNIIKLSPLHWANYSSYCIDTKPNMFISQKAAFAKRLSTDSLSSVEELYYIRWGTVIPPHAKWSSCLLEQKACIIWIKLKT